MTEEEFKWDVLADLVSEDYQMLWEPLGWARTHFADSTESELRALVERVLNDLHDNGLVYLFRVGADHDVNASAEDRDRRLDPEQARTLIAGNDWRTVPPGPDGVRVWIGPTKDGETAVENAPPDIRALWGRQRG